ncbi:MAG: 30S ribosomal protein S12 methylthiotransferase RimO [Bacteroidales bacterium]|nr:30S ribosomal protein S12 methylthiotransferase RimO [Bacteroidales bacterium]
MPPKQKINVITLGCSKNLIDSEILMRQLGDKYIVEHDSNEQADVLVINTCGFIGDAKEESVDAILQAVEAKKNGDLKKVFVTGCLSERYKAELKDEIKTVDGFFGVNELPEVLAALEVDLKKELLGERLITTPSHFAYLKISEGCDRNCSFCAIPLIRGKHKSKSKEEIIREVKFLASKGVKELLLIAQDLTYYGVDIYGKKEIADLVSRISDVPGIEWIRLHYAYPAQFPVELLQLMKENPKVCNYLDIPLQHISDRILKSMKRGLGELGTVNLVEKIKKEVPDAVLRTTLIVGYPGETEEEFEQLLDFVEKYRFDRLGVFKYAHEEGTPAFELKDDVAEETKQDRLDRLMMLQQQISFDLNKQKEGQLLKVIIDRQEGGYYIGRTEFDSPEVDNEVLIADSGLPLTVGSFYTVQIQKADFFDLYGEVVTGA